MPRCDSSETYMRVVRPSPSPADLRLGLAAGVSEVSRFSCMKFLGVSGVFDYAGLNRNSRSAPAHVAYREFLRRRRPDCIFSELNTHPAYTSVYASRPT